MLKAIIKKNMKFTKIAKFVSATILITYTQLTFAGYTIIMGVDKKSISFVEKTSVPEVPETPVEPPIEITGSIAPSASAIAEGQSATISWTYNNIDSITIDGVGTSTLSGGYLLVTPTVTTTYNVTITKGNITKNETVTITVIKFPAVSVAIPIINTHYYNQATVAAGANLVFTLYSKTAGSIMIGRDATNSYDIPLPTKAPLVSGVYKYYVSAYLEVDGVRKYATPLVATVTVP